jgi:putative transposase
MMTEIVEAMPNLNGMDQQQFAQALVAQARSEGVELIGPGGLLTGLTKSVLETALEAEITEHLGYDQYDPAGRDGGNSRNGTRTKTLFTEIGPVEIEVPRDRDGTFEPAIVKKRQRRLSGVDQIILSLSARGLTTGEISAHFADVYGATVSKDTISRITDKVLEEMADWRGRPLDRVYPVIFIDAIVVKVRDGQVTNRPVYVAIGVSCNGERDILGLWAGDGGEGAKFWLGVLTEIKNRGVEDVCIVVCDGLKGLPDSITTCWPLATVQACVIHLLRNTFRFASRKYWDAMARICGRSTPQRTRPQPSPGSRSSTTSGVSVTRRSPACGGPPGPSSSHSWTTTWRSDASSAPPTPSRASTLATAGRSAHEDTSQPSRRAHDR